MTKTFWYAVACLTVAGALTLLQYNTGRRTVVEPEPYFPPAEQLDCVE